MPKIKICFILIVILMFSGCNVPEHPVLEEMKQELINSQLEDNNDKNELPKFKSIDELLEKIEESNVSYGSRDMMIMNDSMMVNETAMAAGVQESTKDFSTTNSQVEGVEEGELIKTDGEYIYIASKNEIKIIKVNGENMEMLSKFKIKDISEMYIVDNRIVTVSSVWEEVDLPQLPKDVKKENYDYRWYPTNYMKQKTIYTLFDTTDKNNPEKIQEIKADGANLATRLINDKLYYVTNNTSHTYAPFNLYREFNIEIDEKLILPQYYNSIYQKEEIINIDKIMYFPGSHENSFLTVGSFDLSGNDDSKPDIYYGGGNYFYMNTENIIIACQEWRKSTESTSVYKFDINGNYIAQGEVNGQPLNQYSMDIYNENFRIATTLNWRDGNNLYILDKDLREIGLVSDIAPSERIQSVRFMGDMAYMVTFRNTDPLFALDLSNPESPTVLGELKIPGFSQYLHPVDDNLLVGFGRNTEEIISMRDGLPVSQGFKDIGLKVSLFDISDATDLKEISVLTYGEQELYSEAFTNPRAIMVDDKKNIFGFPVIGFDGEQEEMYDVNPKDIWYGGMIISVEDEELKEIKKIEHGRLSDETYLYNINQDNYMTRIVYIDDYLYIVSGNKVSSFNYNTFELLSSLELN